MCSTSMGMLATAWGGRWGGCRAGNASDLVIVLPPVLSTRTRGDVECNVVLRHLGDATVQAEAFAGPHGPPTRGRKSSGPVLLRGVAEVTPTATRGTARATLPPVLQWKPLVRAPV